MTTVRKLITKRTLFMAKIQDLHLSSQDLNKIEFLNFLKRYQIILKLFGVIPYTGPRRILRYLQKLWCIAILSVICIMCTVEICFMSTSLTTLEKGLYFCELFLYSLVCATIYSCSFQHTTQFFDIPEKLANIFNDLQLCWSTPTKLYDRLKMEVLVLSCCLIVFELACVSVNIAYRPLYSGQIVRSFVAYNLPNILIDLNLCIYWLALRYIALLYACGNEILKSLRQTPSRTSRSLSRTTLWLQRELNAKPYKRASLSLKVHEIFLALSQANCDLSELLTDIVDIFRIILVLNFLNSFLVLTVEFFALYKYFDNPTVSELKLVLFKFIWLLLHSGRIFFVLITNNAITTQKCRTLYILNALPLEIFDSENNITQFLLQIMVRKHTETACGIVDLDLMFLLGIINGLAMYIIFLIQIDLGNTSIGGTNSTVTANNTQ